MNLNFFTLILNTVFGIIQGVEQFCNCGIQNDRSGRILGGKPAEPNALPWQAAVKIPVPSLNETFFFGGSLISSTWVLTAAHVIRYQKLSLITVVLGEQNVSDDDLISEEFSVKALVPNPDFNEDTIDGDIGLIELKTKVRFNGAIRPVCLPFNQERLLQSGATLTISGFGRIYTEGPYSKILLDATVYYIPTVECRNPPYNYTSIGTEITDNMFCASKNDTDTCVGDSGGPITRHDSSRVYQVGVVSFGEGCGDPKFPGVYTKVENYLDWIKYTTNTTYCRPGLVG